MKSTKGYEGERRRRKRTTTTKTMTKDVVEGKEGEEEEEEEEAENRGTESKKRRRKHGSRERDDYDYEEEDRRKGSETTSHRSNHPVDGLSRMGSTAFNDPFFMDDDEDDVSDRRIGDVSGDRGRNVSRNVSRGGGSDSRREMNDTSSRSSKSRRSRRNRRNDDDDDDDDDDEEDRRRRHNAGGGRRQLLSPPRNDEWSEDTNQDDDTNQWHRDDHRHGVRSDSPRSGAATTKVQRNRARMLKERRARMEDLANDVVREAGVTEERHDNIRQDLRSSISKIERNAAR